MSKDPDEAHLPSPVVAARHVSSASPGRATPTSRLPASARSVARALAEELRGGAHTPVQAKGQLDLDSAEVHAIASRGTEGTGRSLPFLDQIQRAFGRHDVSGVKAHVGGAASEAARTMGARAYASGDRVAFARDPDLFLAAHEAAHVVQQRGGVQLSGGVGRSGDAYEQHADEVAAAVVAGQSAATLLDRHAGSGGGSAAVQRDDDEDDPEERLPRRVRRAMREEDHRGGRQEEQDIYLGTDIGAVDEDGAPQTRHVGGGDSQGRTDLGLGRSMRGGTQRTRRTGDRGTEFHDEVDEQVRTPTHTTTREGRQVQQLDSAAMAADLKAQLEHTMREEDRLARREGRDRTAEHQARVAALRQDIARLEQVQPADDPAVVREVADRQRMLVRPQYRVTSGDMTTRERGLDPDAAPGTVRHRDRVTTSSTHGEESSTHVREDRREADLGNGTMEVGHREEDEFQVGEARGRRVSDRSTRMTVDDGVRRTRREEQRRMLTDPDGTEREHATVRERRGGIVADENGWGVTQGRTETESQRVGDTTTSVTRSRDATLLENGATGQASTERSVEHGDTTFGTKSSADGSFTIDIEAQDQETPPSYRLVFTIHVGVAAGVSVEHGGDDDHQGFRGGAHVRGRASGDLVLRRTIDEATAQRYWDEAERRDRADARASGQHSDLPEFGRLDRIMAGLENADQIANARAIAGDAGAAREMQDGEETELTLRAGVSEGASAGHRGEGHDVGLEGERDDEWTRRVLVQRIGSGDAARVRVTVTYEHSDTWHVSGEGSVGGSPTLGARRGGGSGDGDSFRFTLNPSDRQFDAHYQAILRTTGRDEIRALANNPEYQQELDYREHTESEDTEGSESIEQGGMSLAMMRRAHYDERVRRGRDALSGEANGSQDTSMEIGGEDDMVLARGGNEGSAHSVVERDGQMDVTLEHREHETDPLRAHREAREAAEHAGTEERVRDAVRQTPRERLRALLSTEYETLRGFYLDEDDIETVVGRAADRAHWDQCASSPRMLEAWHALRRQLRSPSVQADEAEIDRAVARRLAIARHLARFYEAHGEYAQTAMHNVLRSWGAAGLAGTRRDSEAADVGSEYEWPHALRSQKSSFETIRAEVRDLERASAGQATQGDLGERDEDHRYERAGSLHERLTAIYTAVLGSRDFDSEGARASLLRAIDEYRTRLRRLRIGHREEARSARETRADGREPDQLDRMMQEARADAEVAHAQIQTLLQRLRAHKRHEQAELRRANQLSYDYSGIPEAVRICGQLHDMAQIWYRDVGELRQAYRTAGVQEPEWEVSTQAGSRSRTLEPEMGWLIEIYLRCHAHNPVDNGRERTAQWRAEFRRY